VGVPFTSEEEDRLTQILTSGISPRVQKLEIKKIPVGQDRCVVIVSVGADRQLRQVKHDDNRFYKRMGKLTLVMEASDVAHFHAPVSPGDRLADINSSRWDFETQVRSGRFHGLPAREGILALSIFPQNAPARINLGDPSVDWLREFTPMYCAGWDRQFRGGAVLTFATGVGVREPYSVAEFTDTGEILAANSLILSNEGYFKVQLPEGAFGYVPSIAYEREVIISVHRYLNLLWKLCVAGPWKVGLSLLNVRGYIMSVSVRMSFTRIGRIHSSDDIVAPFIDFANDTEVSDTKIAARKLRVAFDYIWREFNYSQSANYNEQGEWSESLQ
jgi:hypothetical protein